MTGWNLDKLESLSLNRSYGHSARNLKFNDTIYKSKLKRLALSGDYADLSYWISESESCLCVEELDIEDFSRPFTLGKFPHLKRLSIR